MNKWTYPLPITRNFKQHTVAVFTAKFTPDQREKQLHMLFDLKALQIEKLAQQKKTKQNKPKKSKKSKKARRHKRKKTRLKGFSPRSRECVLENLNCFLIKG